MRTATPIAGLEFQVVRIKIDIDIYKSDIDAETDCHSTDNRIVQFCRSTHTLNKNSSSK